MAGELEALKRMEYPGRVIIIGKSPSGDDVVMYAITGRSPSSQARRLEVDEERKHIYVKPTDEETLKTGQPELLVYSAIMCENGIVVGNGKQTTDINASIDKDKDPAQVLVEGQLNWIYEPDEPNYTPRISGCITAKGAALSVCKRGDNGGVVKNYLGVDCAPGKGKMIATYTGVNEKPLPSFVGEPLDVDLPYSDAQQCVEAMYEALGPEEGKPDFRVTAACAFGDAQGDVTLSVKNRHA
jgi:IMP cyclohydrolase